MLFVAAKNIIFGNKCTKQYYITLTVFPVQGEDYKYVNLVTFPLFAGINGPCRHQNYNTAKYYPEALILISSHNFEDK